MSPRTGAAVCSSFRDVETWHGTFTFMLFSLKKNCRIETRRCMCLVRVVLLSTSLITFPSFAKLTLFLWHSLTEGNETCCVWRCYIALVYGNNLIRLRLQIFFTAVMHVLPRRRRYTRSLPHSSLIGSHLPKHFSDFVYPVTNAN